MKRLSIYLLLGFAVLTSCEDNKKAAAGKTEAHSSEAKKTDSVPVPDEKVKKDDPTEITSSAYPKITNENVVEFLTQYGKENPETKVRISTTHGDIDIELYQDTPLHRANFIYLVKQNYFYGTFFHRVVPNFIIQAGNSDNRTTTKKGHKLERITYYQPNSPMAGNIREAQCPEPRNIVKTPTNVLLPSNFSSSLVQHRQPDI